MKNKCQITIEFKNDEYVINSENMSPVEVAKACGILQTHIGRVAVARGMDVETVKTSLLDIHLEAMHLIDTFKGKDGQ